MACRLCEIMEHWCLGKSWGSKGAPDTPGPGRFSFNLVRTQTLNKTYLSEVSPTVTDHLIGSHMMVNSPLTSFAYVVLSVVEIKKTRHGEPMLAVSIVGTSAGHYSQSGYVTCSSTGCSLDQQTKVIVIQLTAPRDFESWKTEHPLLPMLSKDPC